MQSEMADFFLVPPPGELHKTYMFSLVPPIHSIMWRHAIIHKSQSTQRMALPSEEDQASATGNIYRQSGDIWTCGFWDMRADRQTDRHTHRHANNNTSHSSWGKV